MICDELPQHRPAASVHVHLGEFLGPQVERTTVAELADAFLLDYSNNKYRSIDDARERWKLHLEPFFGGLRANQVTEDLLRKYVDKRFAETASNATVNREMAALRRMFHLGRKKIKYIPEFPHYTERKRTGFLPDAQYQKLTEETGKVGLWMRAMFEMGVTYGWRTGELLNLKVANVDLLSRTIRLEPGTAKNGEGREVAMTPAVFELLRECVAGKNGEDHVFTRGKGKPVADFRGAWHRVCIAAGLGKMFCASCAKDILESKTLPDMQRETAIHRANLPRSTADGCAKPAAGWRSRGGDYEDRRLEDCLRV